MSQTDYKFLKALSGLSFGTATTIANGDSLIVALGKLQAQLNNVFQVSFFNRAGAVSGGGRPSKIWFDVVTPTTANAFSIDISSAGFSNVLDAKVICVKNVTTAVLCAEPEIKSRTTSALVVNITEGVTLGVGGGATKQFVASLTGLSLSVMVWGN